MPDSETQHLRDSGPESNRNKWAFIMWPSVLERVSCDSAGGNT